MAYSTGMNHPETILRTLDRHLTRPVQLILYGRAALALGFPSPDPEFESTMDVDAILPLVRMELIESDDQFWTALDKTNQELEPQGLYITHLFSEDQVILSRGWLDHLVPIELAGLLHLSLFRPSTTDLILTKMMRIDPQDRTDIRFLLQRAEPGFERIFMATEAIHLPDIPEIISAFEGNRKWLIELLSEQTG
jgi:hypothetical protein